MWTNIKEFLKRNKKIILIALAISLILLIILLSIPSTPKPEIVATSTVPGEDIINSVPIQTRPASTKEKANASVVVVAKNFTEIYGTYSNQSNFINIESLLSLLTPTYASAMNNFLIESRANYSPEFEYEGITTVVINTNIDFLDLESGNASVTLKTQRKKSKGSKSNYTIEYKDINLDLIKINDEWLVDNSKWL